MQEGREEAVKFYWTGEGEGRVVCESLGCQTQLAMTRLVGMGKGRVGDYWNGKEFVGKGGRGYVPASGEQNGCCICGRRKV